MPRAFSLTAEQLGRERSMRFALIADFSMITVLIFIGALGGSLTMIAEAVRSVLMVTTEVFALMTMRRIHRGLFAELEFGSDKVEQIANLTIAAGLLIGAAWICWSAAQSAFGAREAPSPAGLAAGAMFAATNVYLNSLTWLSVRLNTPEDAPVIMKAQLQARNVKMVSSGFVLAPLTISALFVDPAVALWCDGIGALGVAAFMVYNAVGMIRGGMPDLLDQCADEAVQQGVNRSLAQHFDAYDRLDRVRTRRAGKTVFIELALGFEPTLTVAEMERRVQALQATIQREIDGADVSILVSPPSAAA